MFNALLARPAPGLGAAGGAAWGQPPRPPRRGSPPPGPAAPELLGEGGARSGPGPAAAAGAGAAEGKAGLRAAGGR